MGKDESNRDEDERADKRSGLEPLLSEGRRLIAETRQKCFELDQIWAARKDAMAKGLQKTATQTQKGRCRRVLVVDDNVAIRELLARFLFSEGHSWQLAADGIEALRQLEGTDFDLVMTDLHMPGMTGEQLVQEIKKRKPKLPVLLITGNEPPVVSRVFDGVLRKPFSFDQLREAIDVLP